MVADDIRREALGAIRLVSQSSTRAGLKLVLMASHRTKNAPGLVIKDKNQKNIDA